MILTKVFRPQNPGSNLGLELGRNISIWSWSCGSVSSGNRLSILCKDSVESAELCRKRGAANCSRVLSIMRGERRLELLKIGDFDFSILLNTNIDGNFNLKINVAHF